MCDRVIKVLLHSQGILELSSTLYDANRRDNDTRDTVKLIHNDKYTHSRKWKYIQIWISCDIYGVVQAITTGERPVSDKNEPNVLWQLIA